MIQFPNPPLSPANSTSPFAIALTGAPMGPFISRPLCVSTSEPPNGFSRCPNVEVIEPGKGKPNGEKKKHMIGYKLSCSDNPS